MGGRRIVVGVAVALIVTACSGGDDSDSAGSGKGEQAGATATPDEGWTHLGRDLGNSRAALDDDIDPDNVASLAPAWELADVKGVTGTPIVDDGTVYVGSWDRIVRALDAETGEVEWEYDVAGGLYVAGAVALDDDRVYVGAFDQRVIALDRKTGEELWETRTGDHPMGGIFGSPILADGLVIVGAASFELMIAERGEATFRGYAVALDVETGEEAWRYEVTAADPTPGPGVGVWGSVTVDTERGHVYVPTGNSYALPASPRSDSLIALDLTTGEEQWVRQFTANDGWMLNTFDGPDADVGAPPNLFEVDGQPAVGVGDKAGRYHALDRETGDELWSTQVTTGGLQGGFLSSAAYADGVVYAASNKESRNADLAAIDSETGEVQWQVDVQGHVAGPVTWANGVVFLGDNGGKIAAYDAASGAVLWSYATEDGSAGGISVVDGTVYAGWGYNELGPPEEDAKGGLIAFRPSGDGDGGSTDTTAAAGDGEEAASGEDVYDEHCSSCHGDDGQGGSGPSMEGVADRLTRDEQLEIVRDGRNQMPDWEGTLSEEEIEAVVDYQRDVLSQGS